jgi:hypothetical protein
VILQALLGGVAQKLLRDAACDILVPDIAEIVGI